MHFYENRGYLIGVRTRVFNIMRISTNQEQRKTKHQTKKYLKKKQRKKTQLYKNRISL